MSRQKAHRVALRHLPSQLIREPVQQRIRAKSQSIQRTTFVLITVMLVFFFVFTSPDLTGRATTPTTANITLSPITNCSISLAAGLNIISLNCVSNSEDRDSVLANTDTTVLTAIYEYRNQQTDPWHVYNPSLPSYVINDLKKFSRLKGYVITIDPGQNTIIDYSGLLAAQSTIPIFTDNNLVGYPSILNRSLPGALTTIADTYSRVRTYNGTTWVEFNTTDGAAGGLSNLTPTEGYWITSTAIDSWVVSRS